MCDNDIMVILPKKKSPYCLDKHTKIFTDKMIWWLGFATK